EDVDLLLARDVAAGIGADGVPGWKARDVRREHVLAGDGDAHLKDGPDEDEVGCLAPGAVDRRDLDGEVVDDTLAGSGDSRLVLGGDTARNHTTATPFDYDNADASYEGSITRAYGGFPVLRSL